MIVYSIWLSICLLICVLISWRSSIFTASGTKRLASGVTFCRILSTFTRPASSLTVSRHSKRTWSLQPHSDNLKRSRSLSLYEKRRICIMQICIPHQTKRLPWSIALQNGHLVDRLFDGHCVVGEGQTGFIGPTDKITIDTIVF